MSNYKDCQNHVNSFINLKMDTKDGITNDNCFSPYNASPPDFDFNIPCRFFKSSFARSLSLNNSSSTSSYQCKSLDYDLRSNASNNNKLSCLNRDKTAVPPLPQRRLSQAGTFYQQNEANASEHKHVFTNGSIAADDDDEEKPPALPARCPVNLNNSTLIQNSSVNEGKKNEEQKLQQQQQNVLTQLRQQAYKQASNPILMVVNDNNQNNNNSNNKSNINSYNNMGLHLSPQQPALNQKPHPNHFTASANKNDTGNNNSNNRCNSSCHSSSIVNNKNNFRRNNIVWSNQRKNVEQNCIICNFDQVNADGNGDELNSNYNNNTTQLSEVNDYNNHFHNNTHQVLLHTRMMPTINTHSNQQQQQQQQLQQNQKQQQQQQQHQQHHLSSYEILSDNTTNVEAVILQNQVDSLQWQLKQMETSCDMYRAVMEEVARFLERYQSQKQLQQQQQQKQQQQTATQKHYNSNNTSNNNNDKIEQIPRSKSLFQVYVAGGQEKSTNGNNILDETATTTASLSSSSKSKSATYSRARSSTNLIDLKHQQVNSSCNSKSKDDLTPSQSYSAFKDFTWRRSPKKFDSRSNIAKDDIEEKLNQEAFRLLRTIQNLLNTSQHQPDLTSHRQTLTAATTVQIERLSNNAISTTLPAVPLIPINSANIITNSTSASSLTPEPSTATVSPTVTTATNDASSNLAPELHFLRSANNMRDSRLSLRSSTDSSVHSTSSVTSSASSKLETDEETSTQFHHPIPTNILARKQQHQNLAGSSTEDESGFSSISSFPEIGAHLNSTMLSSTPTGNKSRLFGKESKSLKANEKDLQSTESRNSTLKANVVGLPMNSSQDMSHRWDSPSKTYHNASNKFQRFSALTNEDSNAVLWV